LRRLSEKPALPFRRESGWLPIGTHSMD